MKSIKYFRKAKGYTLEELGKFLGVGKSTISNWEHGRRTPKIENLRELAKVFGVTIDELVGSEKETV